MTIKLRYPIESNFKKMIFKMLFVGLISGDLTPETNSVTRSFFENASFSFDDENVKTNMNEIENGLEPIINRGESIELIKQHNKFAGVAVMGGFLYDGDIVKVGYFEFYFNSQGFLYKVGFIDMK